MGEEVGSGWLDDRPPPPPSLIPTLPSGKSEAPSGSLTPSWGCFFFKKSSGLKKERGAGSGGPLIWGKGCWETKTSQSSVLGAGGVHPGSRGLLGGMEGR